LVVDEIFISLGEQLLIAKFGPLWNTLVDGFGGNQPGGGRRGQKRSAWDTLHRGRKTAKGLPPNPKSASRIVEEVEKWFVSQVAPGR